MLKELINDGFGEEQDLNCAEKILYGANQVYCLGLSPDSLKIAAGFGGGMGIESVCGALTASIMVLSKLAVVSHAHESSRIKQLAQDFFASYQNEMKSIDCTTLKKNYRNDEIKCKYVIMKAAEILDKMVISEKLVKL